jgi:integrase
VAALLRQTQSLKTPLRTATLRTLIGLLAVTGMRLGEALAVDDDDFDTDAGLLLVRHGKFGNYAEDAVMPSPVTVGVAGGGCAQDCSA